MSSKIYIIFLILHGLTIYSCTSVKKTDPSYQEIVDDYCKCKERILQSKMDKFSKGIELENCTYKIIKLFEEKAKDSISLKKFKKEINSLIEKNCSDNAIRGLFNAKMKPKLELAEKCKDYFKDGDYVPVGNNVPIIITRIGLKNISTYIDSKCVTISDIRWIDDCKYYLIMKSTDCPEQKRLIGDSMLVNILDIKFDTVYFEMIIKNQSYPGIMKRKN